MEAALPDQVLHCTQCGGELHPDEGQIFLTCPFCGSTVYIDKSKVVFHWYLAPTLDEQKARAALMRWMAGNQTVKDLDRKSTLVSTAFEYFPIWYFKRRDRTAVELVTLEPAAATSITEIEHMHLPAGDLRKYDGSIAAEARMPTVPLQTAFGWMGASTIDPPAGGAKDETIEQALVHVPLFTFKYNYKGSSYTAVVEAGTGGVFANIYPAKAETPYRTVGGVTAAIFLCLAVVPLAMAVSRGWEGTGIGLLICIGAGLVFVPILIAAAAAIAGKV